MNRMTNLACLVVKNLPAIRLRNFGGSRSLSNAQALVAYWGFVQYGRCLRCLSGVETPKTEVCLTYLCAS